MDLQFGSIGVASTNVLGLQMLELRVDVEAIRRTLRRETEAVTATLSATQRAVNSPTHHDWSFSSITTLLAHKIPLAAISAL